MAWVLIAGCQSSPAPTTPAGSSVEGRPVEDPFPAAKVELQPASFGALAQAIRDHQGKVVLIDFWAEHCPPCVDGMPHLVELQERYGQDQFVIITVNLDEPVNRTKALNLLQRNQARLINLARDPADRGWQVLTFQIIPHSWLYDRQGKRVYDGSGLHHLVTKQVEKLMAD